MFSRKSKELSGKIDPEIQEFINHEQGRTKDYAFTNAGKRYLARKSALTKLSLLGTSRPTKKSEKLPKKIDSKTQRLIEHEQGLIKDRFFTIKIRFGKPKSKELPMSSFGRKIFKF